MGTWHRIDILAKMEHYGVVPTVFANSVDDYLEIVVALLDGGLPIIELLSRERSGVPPRITFDALYKIKKLHGDSVLAGCGTLQNAGRAESAINAGADFLVSNLVDQDVIRVGHENCTLVTPGASTDSEVGAAIRLGCLAVKILLPEGASKEERLKFFRHFFGHFSRMTFFPTMGVKPEEVPGFLEAGAPFVVMGATSDEILTDKSWGRITEKTKKFLEAVHAAREAQGGLR